MFPAFKALARGVVAGVGLPRLLHRTALRDRLTILMYHAVVREPLEVPDWCFLDEESFRRQADYLARHFDVLPLLEAVERLRQGLKRPTAAITFDDGFQNNRDVAWPILRERGLPAAIFLATGLVGTSDTVWPCRIGAALARTRQGWLDWEGRRFDLSGPGARSAAGAALQARLKPLPHPRLLEAMRGILRELGASPEEPIPADSPYRILDREAVKELAASGLVEFGAHTDSHAILSLLPPRERAEEIGRSVAAVAELTGTGCRLFAYPNGRVEDYDAETVAAVAARGVKAAVTSQAGPNHPGTPPLELRRYGVGAGLPMGRFVLAVHHWAREDGRPRR